MQKLGKVVATALVYAGCLFFCALAWGIGWRLASRLLP